MTGEVLRNDLEAIFQVVASNSDKIAPGGSTKDVESFNNMIASKAPKRCHYSSSSSLKNRVGCAVAHKNLGNGYVNKVNTDVAPGRIYALHAKRKDTERKRLRKYQGSVENKRRRLQLKYGSKMDNKNKEIREGVTYQSGVANTNTSDITEIPPPQFPHHKMLYLKMKNVTKFTVTLKQAHYTKMLIYYNYLQCLEKKPMISILRLLDQ